MTQYIDPKEFVDFGHLQELNRGYLHPLGMALAVLEEDDGSVSLAGIIDHRDDPEGMIFTTVNKDKAERVARERDVKMPVRTKALGFWQQPVEPIETVE